MKSTGAILHWLIILMTRGFQLDPVLDRGHIQIEALECSIEFSRIHFDLAEYMDQQGKSRKMYKLTHDGFH